MQLNPEQQAVVEHIFGAALVMAPAGSGKTTLLALRAEQALAHGIAAGEMLFLTFTNLAAQQLRKRVELTAPEQARNIWMGTFHGFCASVLRIEAKQMGIPGDFVIYDDDDCQALLAHLIKQHQFKEHLTPASAITAFDNAKAGFTTRRQDDTTTRRVKSVTRTQNFSYPAHPVYPC